MDLLNDITNQWVSAFIKRPQSAVLIHSNDDRRQGIAVAEYIYKTLRSDSTIQLYRVERSDKKSIGIDDVKDLQRYVTLRANDTEGYSRFILIPEAEKLTSEAQNNLLKLVEEISEKTIIMFVESSSDTLLPTVVSRCFSIQILPITLLKAQEYGLSKGISKPDINKAFTISEGKVTILKELLVGNNDTLNKTIALSKDFLQSTVFDRQKLLQRVYAENINIHEFLQSLQLMARTGMRNSNNTNAKIKWKNILSQIILAQEQLQRNVQSKLVMLALSVSI